MNKIIRDSAKLLSANVVAQAIGLLVYPILTRLYSPDDFGVLNLFMSIGGVLVLLSTAEYQYAIVLPKEEKKARHVRALCAMILSMVSGFVLLTLPFAKQIAGIFKAPALADIWVLMPLYVLNVGLWNILNYWYLRKKEFNRISGYQVSQSVLSAGGKIGFGFAGWTTLGLPLGSVLAQIGALGLSLSLGWKKIKSPELIEWKDCRAMAKEYKNFPLFNLPRTFVNSLGQALPFLLLTPFFGADHVGQLSLALMAAYMPLNLIARSCYQILFQRVSEAVHQEQSIHNLIKRFILWTGGITAVCLIGVWILVPLLPQLIAFLFGKNWSEAADIILYLLPYLALTPICGSLCFLADVFAKQKIAMWMETCYVVGIAIALIVGTRFGTFLSTVSAYSWVRFGYLFIQLLWLLSLVRTYHRKLK